MEFDYFEMTNISDMKYTTVIESSAWMEVDDFDCDSDDCHHNSDCYNPYIDCSYLPNSSNSDDNSNDENE